MLPRFRSEKAVFTDPKTGRAIWKMTNGRYASYVPYMYRRGFSHDQRHIICSSHRSGRDEVYRIEVDGGEITQLSDNIEYYNRHLALGFDATGHDIYFIAGDTLRAVDVDTGEMRTVCNYRHLTNGQPAGMIIPNGDGSAIQFTYHKPDERVGVALVKTGRHLADETPQEFHAFPPGVGTCHWLFCPTDNNLMTYNALPDYQNDAEFSLLARPRAWKYDLRTGVHTPFLVMPKGFRAMHEYWAPDGSKLYFHTKKAGHYVPASIASIDRDAVPTEQGTEITHYYRSNDQYLGHSSVNAAQTHIVSDSYNPESNALYLIDMKRGTARVITWTNVSGKGHPHHVHPAFSPDGKHVLYTTDSDGFPQVFIAPNVV